MDYVKKLKEQLQQWRDGNGSGSYENVFSDAESLVGEIVIDQLPGSRRQPRTANSTPFDHYRQQIYVPFVDYFMNELTSRFSEQSTLAIKLSQFLPHSLLANNVCFEDLKETVQLYEELLPGDTDLQAVEEEFERWVNQWKNVELSSLPTSIVEAIDCCSASFLPSIHALLRIFATIPVSTATAERSFSALKLLKSYLRATMSEQRISALALCDIHSDLDVKTESIIDRFAVKNRRLKFNL